MGRHRDAEPDLEPGAPIFSYSFLSDGVASTTCSPRLFDVYRLGARKPIAAIPLGHGDVLIMAGTMQETHEHGVRVSAAKAGAVCSFVNFIVLYFHSFINSRTTQEAALNCGVHAFYAVRRLWCTSALCKSGAFTVRRRRVRGDGLKQCSSERRRLQPCRGGGKG